jgi:hypothetical protein
MFLVDVLGAVARETSVEELRTVLGERGDIVADATEVNCQGAFKMEPRFFAGLSDGESSFQSK